MKINKQYMVLILSFLFLLLGTTISYGAYSASSSTVESGRQVSITVTSSDALEAYNLDLQGYEGLTFNSCSKVENGAIININGSSIGYMNLSGSTNELGTYNFTAPNVTENKTYTITFLVDKEKTVTTTITVKAPSTTTPETPVTKSSEARLRDLGITPNDFKGFKRDITTYNVEVPNNVSKVNVYAKPVDSKATVSGDGNVTLKEGLNKVDVTVTAEDGKTKKTYTLNITRKAESDTTEEQNTASSEARLSNLGIRPKDYDFSGFKRDNTSYEVEVPNDIEEVEVYAEAVSSKAKVTGTGKVSLKEGLNTVEVIVTAEDGKTKKTYTLNITRQENSIVDETEKQPEENTKEELELSALLIKNINLSPKFNSKTYEYTVGLTEDLSSLEIDAKANDSSAIVEIIGNENLQEGENIITILVSNAETGENATYQIIVNKNSIKEVTGTVDWLKPSTWGLKEKIIIGVVIALVMIIIVAVVMKIKLARNEEEDLDLPGAEELDKALAEHQELAEDTTDQIQQEEVVENEQEDDDTKSDIEKAQEYFESYSKRRGKHF